MIRHLVFLDIQNDPKAVADICDSLKALSKKMPGCKQFHFGECNGVQMSHYFYMDFDTEAQRNHYVEDHEHAQIAQQVIIPQLKEGIQSALIFDYRYKVSHTPDEQTSYIFVKDQEAEITEVLKKLAGYCRDIEQIKPLQNCSQEPLGKDYAFALRVKAKLGSEPVRLGKAASFWANQPQQSALSSQSLSLPRSRL